MYVMYVRDKKDLFAGSISLQWRKGIEFLRVFRLNPLKDTAFRFRQSILASTMPPSWNFISRLLNRRSSAVTTMSPAPKHDPSSADETIVYRAPTTLELKPSNKIFSPPKKNTETDCAICLSKINHSKKTVVSLAACGHCYHSACIVEALKKHRQCPICRKFLGTPLGKMPSGQMQVEYDGDETCEGSPPGTFVITYIIRGGKQKEYHENPGVGYGSTQRCAFVPSTSEGIDLLKRLKFAFRHGLSFTVGTSLTTGQPNSVTWSSIHHKTSTCAGPHGFPDPNYFTNCNTELDNLGVPSASDI